MARTCPAFSWMSSAAGGEHTSPHADSRDWAQECRAGGLPCRASMTSYLPNSAPCLTMLREALGQPPTCICSAGAQALGLAGLQPLAHTVELARGGWFVRGRALQAAARHHLQGAQNKRSGCGSGRERLPARGAELLLWESTTPDSCMPLRPRSGHRCARRPGACSAPAHLLCRVQQGREAARVLPPGKPHRRRRVQQLLHGEARRHARRSSAAGGRAAGGSVAQRLVPRHLHLLSCLGPHLAALAAGGGMGEGTSGDGSSVTMHAGRRLAARPASAAAATRRSDLGQASATNDVPAQKSRECDS